MKDISLNPLVSDPFPPSSWLTNDHMTALLVEQYDQEQETTSLSLRNQHAPFILSPVGHRQSSGGGSNCSYLAEEAEVGHMQTGILCSGYWLNKDGQVL